MMIMLLDGKTGEPISVTSYSRTLDIPDPDVRFQLNITFSGEYSSDGIEYLANYAGVVINKIKIIDDQGNVLLYNANANARLQNLVENCDAQGRYGYATIAIYEPAAT